MAPLTQTACPLCTVGIAQQEPDLHLTNDCGCECHRAVREATAARQWAARSMEWWAQDAMVIVGLAGDEGFVADASTPDDAARLVAQHNADLEAAQEAPAPDDFREGQIAGATQMADHVAGRVLELEAAAAEVCDRFPPALEGSEAFLPERLRAIERLRTALRGVR